MEFFGLNKELKGRDISSVLLKILGLKQLKNKIIKLNIGGNLELFVEGVKNEGVSKKINEILKTDILEGDIVMLLSKMDINNNIGRINDFELFINFVKNSLFIYEDEKDFKNSIVEHKEKKVEKKETKIKLSNDLDYTALEAFSYETIKIGEIKSNNVLKLLEQSVIFASDNGIGDVVISQDEKIYFIKGEENIHNDKLDQIIEKIQGKDGVFSSTELKNFLEQMISLAAEKSDDEKERQEYKDTLYSTLKKLGAVDFAVKVSGRKLRVNFSYSNGKKLGAVMRVIESGTPPKMEDLGLVGGNNGTAYRDVLSFPFGLILVVGPTGSGKSFSLTSMLGEINRTKYKHIITLEDPIEFEHENVLSKIEQKEVGVDVDSYKTGLKAILRQKPHIAVCGEIRDGEVMEKALELSATGHVVFATFHANDVISTIQRIMDFFPVEKQKAVLQQLGEFILGIFVQKLVSRVGGGKVLIKEIMIKTEGTQESIMANDMKTLYGYIEAGAKYGMITNDKSIESLYTQGLIDQKTAVDFAKDKAYIKRLTNYDEYANI